MKILPSISREQIDFCDDPIEKSLLFLIRKIQHQEEIIKNALLIDKQRVEQIQKLENKIRGLQ